MEKTIPCKGYLALRPGNFYLEGESFPPQEQLPQFLPRLEWPADPTAGREHRGNLPTVVPWHHGPSSVRQRGLLLAAYPQLKPMSPWVDNRYDGIHWHAHLTKVHALYRGFLREFHEVQPQQMSAMLRSLSYGMSHSTAIMRPWQVAPCLGVIDGVEQTRVMQVQGLGYMREACLDLPGVVLSREDHQQRITGRRWIVVPILHGHQQWTISLFDRKAAQLYIVDTDGQDEQARAGRIRATLSLWVVWWNWIGFPQSLTYFAVPVTKQAAPNDSGLACMSWMIQNLRNGVQDDTNATAALWSRKDVTKVDSSSHPQELTPKLPLHDWPHDGCPTLLEARRSAHNIMRCILANELGLSDDTYFNRPWPRSLDTRSSMSHIADAMHVYWSDSDPHSGLLYPAADFWTNKGGPQYAVPSEDSVQFRPPPTNSHAPEPATANVVKVRTDPASLAYPPPRHDLSWPARPHYNESHTLADSIADLAAQVNANPGRGGSADESDLSHLIDDMRGLFSVRGESTDGPHDDPVGDAA